MDRSCAGFLILEIEKRIDFAEGRGGILEERVIISVPVKTGHVGLRHHAGGYFVDVRAIGRPEEVPADGKKGLLVPVAGS